jgi:Uma2 family endonuclease
MAGILTSGQPFLNQPVDEAAAPRPYHWTREMYYRAAEVGIFEGRRVQLLNGEIYNMAPQRNDHAIAIELLVDALRIVFAKGYRVRIQLPIQAANHSEPEPDAAIIAGSPRGQKDHPTTALLIVEVADTTLHLDRTIKAPLYAEMGVQDYWIVNLNARNVEIHRNPMQNADGTFRYGDIHVADADDMLIPLTAPHAKIAVVDLLP